MQIDGKTLLHGIIGNPVRHSLSPAMHNAAFAALEMNRVYVPMEVADPREGVAALRTLGFIGVSVTVPHKETILAALDEIDPVASRIGAVNTLLLRKKEETEEIIVRGFNTDWVGSNMALAEKMRLAGSKVLVIGAGGAAKAVGFGLREAGAAVIITNRTEQRGRELASWLDASFVPFAEVDAVRADALVNTTSVGMEPDVEAIPLDPGLLGHFKVVMDIVYAPLQTRLLREAAAVGCQTIDGLAMLLYQGAAQFRIWTGIQPPLDVMRRALEEELCLRKKRKHD
ncbi:shikimate dehydrogenase (NADP(+)) [Desulfolithobacter dissulfuricans]|uniref:Shikimate dehydrogenase (NADP(+)) n=1 Tax=Desulfolithobacter dissulfuricans TaxID=2795293 RepID=A0A915U6L2_9BACT|nr:shikimate dehydrogenase [Desulfolithobacter dissulfuricans]BCO10312.1 shikimate dehydrogenase (NADP(+)) [Desulfolithobacter dissulfuricans]